MIDFLSKDVKIASVESDLSESFTENYTILSNIGEIRIRICCQQAYMWISDGISEELDYREARKLVWEAAQMCSKYCS